MTRTSARRRTRRLLFASVALAIAPAIPAMRALAADWDAPVSPSVSARSWQSRMLTVGMANDVIGPPSKLKDDDGFTAALRIMADLPDGDRGLLRLGVTDQLITERGGLDRVDDLRVYAGWQRFLGPSPAQGLTVGWALGVQVVGNLGGSIGQDWAHHNLFSGRHLHARGARQLQNRYPRDYDVLADVGGLVKHVQPIGGPWSLREGVEGTLGFGTGYFGELHPFVAIAFATPHLEVEFRQAAGIYGTNVRPLTMRGGYVTGVLQSQPSLHLSTNGPGRLPTTLSFDLEWNQGDSHQHVGGITIGTRF
jgi:hypothetical protein